MSPHAGFRVEPAELPDRVALAAVTEAAEGVCRAALDGRAMLLGLGFADDHSVCERLDSCASTFASLAGGARLRAREAHYVAVPDPDPALVEALDDLGALIGDIRGRDVVAHPQFVECALRELDELRARLGVPRGEPS